ncbi:hypothetical protein XENORESO_003954 [Xenotaenia resolanae]|uniref:Uncharacterized protein n=1 Tax=Xenotaenia resolanae TaxID=208358 RepID=A0ABV0W1E7_9TELE
MIRICFLCVLVQSDSKHVSIRSKNRTEQALSPVHLGVIYMWEEGSGHERKVYICVESESDHDSVQTLSSDPKLFETSACTIYHKFAITAKSLHAIFISQIRSCTAINVS